MPYHTGNPHGKTKKGGSAEPKKMTMKPPAGLPKPKPKPMKAEEPAKKKMKSGAGLKKGKIPPALQKWMSHLDKVRKDNPKLSMKQAMKKAKSTYKK